MRGFSVSEQLAFENNQRRNFEEKMKKREVLSNAINKVKNWKESSKCSICNKKFGWFTDRRHHCRKCGESVCNNHSKSRKYVNGYIKKKNGHRICNKCVNENENENENETEMNDNIELDVINRFPPKLGGKKSKKKKLKKKKSRANNQS